MLKKVVILGGGLLAKELQHQTNWSIVSRKDNGFDITKPHTFSAINGFTTIINCIAFTDTYSSDRQKHWDTNYRGVYNLIEHCNKVNAKLVHIGTDFLYAGNKNDTPSEEDVPVHSEHWYSYTKLLADGLVQLLSNDYLICRSTHKPFPFPYETAFIDRVGNFDYVNVIASLIVRLINTNQSGIFNVGTDRKSMYDLVKFDNPNITASVTPVGYPKKSTMNVTKLYKALHNEDKI